MPQFQLNDDLRYDRLSDFAKGYVEAMFFTNGDIGDDDEWKLNNLGTGRLTRKALAAIVRDCEAFLALPLGHGKVSNVLAKLADCRNYGLDRAGNDLWFTRQRHGVGFWDRKEIPDLLRDRLSDLAHGMGEAQCDAYRGWIHHA